MTTEAVSGQARLLLYRNFLFKLVSSAGVRRFIVFKSLHGKAKKVAKFCAFSVVYISREHYSFRSTGHVAMVRFKLQLTDVENECY